MPVEEDIWILNAIYNVSKPSGDNWSHKVK